MPRDRNRELDAIIEVQSELWKLHSENKDDPSTQRVLSAAAMLIDRYARVREEAIHEGKVVENILFRSRLKADQ